MGEGSPVEELILEEIKKECPGQCPYKWGDGEQHAIKLKTKLKAKLRFRMAWGHEIRLLEKKYLKLRAGITSIIEASKVGKIGPSEIRILQKLLDDTVHDPVAERYDPSKG